MYFLSHHHSPLTTPLYLSVCQSKVAVWTISQQANCNHQHYPEILSKLTLGKHEHYSWTSQFPAVMKISISTPTLYPPPSQRRTFISIQWTKQLTQELIYLINVSCLTKLSNTVKWRHNTWSGIACQWNLELFINWMWHSKSEMWTETGKQNITIRISHQYSTSALAVFPFHNMTWDWA